MQNYLNFTHFN